jgi:hypothetical protein
VQKTRKIEKVTGSQDDDLVVTAGPPKEMKNTFCPATRLHGIVALPFVIPSGAEGSAVLRTFPGNVFDERAQPRTPN